MAAIPLVLSMLLGCPTTTAPDPAAPPDSETPTAPAPPADDPEPTTPPDAQPPPDAPPGSVPPEQWASDPRVKKSQAQLSASLGVPESSLKVVTVEEVEWNNGAMGCEKPGMSYTQAIVPGYRIVLEHDGKQYSFHGAKDQDPFLCS
ncbi:MAG: hypothetical protein AAGF11_50825 [Myxococcota bacterium]